MFQSADKFAGTDTLFDFHFDSVADTGLDSAAYELLLRNTVGQYVDKGRISRKFQCTFRYSQHIICTLKLHFGIGTVARTDGDTVGNGNGCLDFKLVGSVVFYALGRDIFQYGIEFHVLQGSQSDF